MRKITSKRGETLIETLASLLIATLVMVFLASSMVAAAKLNAATKNAEDDFYYPSKDSHEEDFVYVIDDKGKEEITSKNYEYKDKSGHFYYYYEVD